MGGPLPAMIHVMEAMTSVGLPPSASREEADDYRRFEAIYRELCVAPTGDPFITREVPASAGSYRAYP